VTTPFRFDRSWRFPVTAAELWKTLEQTDRYRAWWPWLHTLTVEGEALQVGTVARLVIQAPLPYQLRCSIRVVDAHPPDRVVTVVEGDLSGPAQLVLAAAGSETDARLTWALALGTPVLRSIALAGGARVTVS
jgi:uncharacterized protein YndB with AHSA1/START domain